MDVFSVARVNELFPQLFARAIVILCCLPLHEYAHAWMASRLGDPTGEREGRLTIKPFAHLDFWGTIMLFIFGVGYAKPVSVISSNFRHPKKDLAIVSLAGPMINLIMAVSFMLAGHLMDMGMGSLTEYGDIIRFAINILRYISYINFGLTVINLIPIPPLDGFHVLMGAVPNRINNIMVRLERFSVYTMVGLLIVCNLLRPSPINIVANSMFVSVDHVYDSLIQ